MSKQPRIMVQDTAAFAPVLDSEQQLFCLLPPGAAVPADLLDRCSALIREPEGTTLVLPANSPGLAGTTGLETSFPCQRMSLSEVTDLAATGIMAGVSKRLAEAGIPCNPMAGYHHDHLYVPAASAQLALLVLQAPADAWQLLACWFGPLDAEHWAHPWYQRRWFNGGKAFDQELASRFGAWHQQWPADGPGRTHGWPDSPLGRLALVLLLDQLSRNLHRGSAAAFAHDQQAQTLALAAIKAGDPGLLAPAHQVFLYLPLHHAEDSGLQAQAVQLFQQLHDRSPANIQPSLARHLASARGHARIIAQFGRFPHRNGALGRTSTAAEQRWLADNPQRFGQ